MLWEAGRGGFCWPGVGVGRWVSPWESLAKGGKFSWVRVVGSGNGRLCQPVVMG